MATTTISRTHYNALVDDDGTGTTGSIWDKQDVDDILDDIDALIAAQVNFGSHISVPAASKFYLDGGGDSYFYEASADAVDFVVGGSSMLFFLNGGGGSLKVFINDNANGNMATGLTINQGASDVEILARKSSDVAHGITTLAETDTYGTDQKASATGGGLFLAGYNGAGGTDYIAFRVLGVTNAVDATRSTAGSGAVVIDGAVKSGTTKGAMGADKNLIVFRNDTSTKAILDSDGDWHLDSTSNNNVWDEHNDLHLLSTVRVAMLPDQAAQQYFADFVNRPDLRRVLAETGVVTFNEDGHHFVSLKGLHALIIDAIRQVGGRVEAIERKLLEAA